MKNLTVRSVIIGLFLTAFLAVVTPVSDLLIQGTWLTACHLPIGVVCVFALLLLGVNPVLRSLGKPFTHAELITIYCMILVSAGIPSLGLSAYLIPILASPFYYQTPENEWADTFFHHIPDWLIPKDTKIAEHFYEGLFSGGSIPWQIWLKPLALWSVFALALFLTWICLCMLLRKQWIERERLIFPLVQLPLEMLGNGNRIHQNSGQSYRISPFFRNGFMWVGFTIPVLIHGLNGLHFHFPMVPEIKLFYDLGRYFTEKPWNVVRPLWLIVHFSVIGFVFLLPTDLAFSLWFFYFAFHLQSVIYVTLGIPLGTSTGYATKGFAAYQMAGAIMVLAIALLWRGRRHLYSVFKTALSSKPTDKDEPLSYRGALLGLFLGIAVMVLWSMVAGISFTIITIVLVLFLLTMIAMTRMVSEGGLLFIQTPFRPIDLISPVAGTGVINSSSLTVLAFQEMVFMFDIRSSLMPSVMDSFKLLDNSKLRRRSLLKPVGVSILVAMVVSYISVITICYRYGGINLSNWFCVGAPQLPFRRLTAMLFNPKDPNLINVIFMGVGTAVMLFITSMRQKFLWWPFHPIGYAMGPSWPMIQLWFSILVGFLCKWSVLKTGGIKLYRKWRPFFLGMVLGEFISGGLWLMIDFLAGKQGHRIFLF